MNLPTLTFTVLLLTFLPSLSLSAPIKSEQSSTTQLNRVNKAISELQGHLKKLDRNRTSTEKNLQYIEQAINQQKKDIRAIEKQTENSRQVIRKLEIKKNLLIEKKDHEKESLATSLRSIYQLHGDDRLKLILNQEDPSAISRQLVYLSYLQNDQLKNIQTFEATLTELKNNAQQQTTINRSLISEYNRLRKERDALNKQRNKRQQLIASLEQQHQQDSQQLNRLEKQRSDLERIFFRLKSQNIPNNTPISTMKGKLSWPIKGKLQYKFKQKHASTKIRWQGIRIEAKEGSPVKAIYDGRVIFSDWLRGYGQLIIIDHGKNYLTLYAHNQTLLKKAGDLVLAGEPIALIGKTGGQTTPGLYFEVRHNGKPLDPLIWLTH